jgi:hypothetical protein
MENRYPFSLKVTAFRKEEMPICSIGMETIDVKVFHRFFTSKSIQKMGPGRHRKFVAEFELLLNQRTI